MIEIKLTSYFTLLIILNIIITIASFDINFIELDNYLENENKVLKVLNNYILSEEKRLHKVKQLYNRFVEQNTLSVEEKKQFLKHPIDVYFLVKELVTQWKPIVKTLESNKQRHRKLVNGLRDQILDQFKLEGKLF